MAEHATSIGAPAAPIPNPLAALIDAVIPLADEILGHGSSDQQGHLAAVVVQIADMALEATPTAGACRLKGRAMRLIYAGHPLGFEEGFREDTLHGGSRAERLALQILAVAAAPQ